jgi:hypothetical protein
MPFVNDSPYLLSFDAKLLPCALRVKCFLRTVHGAPLMPPALTERRYKSFQHDGLFPAQPNASQPEK